MSDSFEISTMFPVSAQRVYEAWLSSKEHGDMTGGAAQIDPCVGGKFSAWDGYISGTTLELEPYHRIVQSWRTLEFPTTAPDSRLEILLEEMAAGTRLILKHSEIPAGQGSSYKSGWADNYFDPMQDYLSD